ncbi:Crp/Fnr family transcriptional regulator [Acuticoccus mangrovi]|uniref:Crp/Fnr family transcriptional regulator n=1 Tax=Acuticoccus mangrovi TaxID=2796142 RepID=A0A934IRG2_9HYPH|nr:Crp/Fnr family transcriptional regulator [Acuticoccus mangrovi]MBJ3777366.1 Crp/Fnr family transcriptional regulator [Acuticoccus mangrovi]
MVASEIGWLSEQPAPFRELVLDRCELRKMPVGQRLYSLGDPPGGIYGMVEGFADVLLASGPFPPQLVYIARAGWWVGEAAAVTASERRVEVRARTNVEILHLPARELQVIETLDTRTWRYFARLTVSHMDNALMLASTLVRGDVRSKIINTLIRLAGPIRTIDAETFVPCTQHELGEIAGLSRNSVGPCLKRLERDGLVSRRVYGQIGYNPVRLARSLAT